MNISLNPSYFCNFSCSFCYLTKKQLNDKAQVSLEKVSQKLMEVIAHQKIEHIDLYGGEITQLEDQYLEKLLDICFRFTESVNINTNFSKIHPLFADPRISISVSYDFSAREQHELVFENMRHFQKKFSILTLASKRVLGLDVLGSIQKLNELDNLSSLEIKPYSSNQANQLKVSHLDYEKFVYNWLKYSDQMNFNFENKIRIEKALRRELNAFSDDHIYITPSGEFAVLEFDKNNNEYFLPLNTVSEYFEWANNEKKHVQNNEFCGSCHYLGTCLTEHYQRVSSLFESCNGHKNLLDQVSRC